MKRYNKVIIILIIMSIIIFTLATVSIIISKRDVSKASVEALQPETVNATTTKETVDVILFTGQSNMKGKNNALMTVEQTPNTAWEYKQNSNSLEALQNPTGEEWGTSEQSSLVPFFCKQYVALTGRKVVAVCEARDAIAISVFAPGSEFYNTIVGKYKNAISCVQNSGYTVGRKFYVFLQGEWDAINSSTTTAEYKQRFLQMHNGFKSDLGMEFCGLIYSGHLGHDYDAADAAGFVNINNAQKQLVNENTDILFASDLTVTYSMGDGTMADDYHYKVECLAEIGKDAATNVVSQIEDTTKPTVSFTSNNGSSTKVKNASVGVKISDDSGSLATMKYIWKNSSTQPSESEFTNTISSATTIINSPAGLNGNYYLYILAKDESGNTTIQRSNVFIFDNTAPTVTVKYSTTDITNQDVTITLTSNEEMQGIGGYTLSSDKLVLTKEVSQKTTETVIAKDIAGNETTISISVQNIDKIKPIIDVKYSTENPTNGEVTVTLTSNEKIQEIEGYTLSEDKLILTKTFTENKSEEITIKDIAGNGTTVSINVQNIDKVKPIIDIKYSTKEFTNGEVTVTITSNKEIQQIEGFTLSQDKKILTRIYTNNEQKTVIVKDLAGNQVEVNINIQNIDKEKAQIEVKYSTTKFTNQDVILTLICDEQIQEIEGFELSSDKSTLTKTYVNNTQEKVIVKDLAGNETEVSINIQNIDKDKPTDTAPTANAEITMIEVINNQEDEYSKIEEIEYSINIDGKWSEWQKENKFNNLKSDTEYQVKTRSTDYAGNVEESKETKVQTLINYGDISDDITIDATDVSRLLEYIFYNITQRNKEFDLTEREKRSSDVTGDGKIDIADTLKIKRHIKAANDENVAEKHPEWLEIHENKD